MGIQLRPGRVAQITDIPILVAIRQKYSERKDGSEN